MSQVMNATERQQAFWKFFFFFLLSTVLIVATVYFDVRIPTKDNEMLREQVSHYKIQATAQEKFVKSMDDARGLIDSLNKPGVNVVYLNQQIAAKIRELSELQYKDSSIYSRLNKTVLDVYLRYQESTNKVVGLGDVPRQLEEYKIKYEQTQRDLDNARRDLDVLRRSTNGSF